MWPWLSLRVNSYRRLMAWVLERSHLCSAAPTWAASIFSFKFRKQLLQDLGSSFLGDSLWSMKGRLVEWPTASTIAGGLEVITDTQCLLLLFPISESPYPSLAPLLAQMAYLVRWPRPSPEGLSLWSSCTSQAMATVICPRNWIRDSKRCSSRVFCNARK